MKQILILILYLVILASLSLLAKAEDTGKGVDPEKFFARWDKNGDGKITLEELGNEKLFKVLDANGDGSVTLEEVKRIFKFGGNTPALSLPPADQFKPREHGEEALKAELPVEMLKQLDIEMQRYIAAKDVAGIIGFVWRKGTVGYFEAFGSMDIEAAKPMQKDAIFRLMSMTKPVIAVAALTLYDEGKFGLDDPISKFLPEWTEPKVMEKDKLVPAKRPITPRMLMSHSSGLYYGELETGEYEGEIPPLVRNTDITLEDYVKLLAQRPLKFHPGEDYSYGTSIDVLARYLEVIGGKPLDELLQERLFGPLKMKDTGFWVSEDKSYRLAKRYRQNKPGELVLKDDTIRLQSKPKLMMGGAGLCSSTEDYARFCTMLMRGGELDGVRILKTETVDLMFKNHLKPGLPNKYGLGGAVNEDGGYSWGGANGTQFWLDRKNDMFALFMVQTADYRCSAYNVFRKTITTVFPQRAPLGGE